MRKRDERLFGTNGVRGIANKELTPDMALLLGKVIGTMIDGRIAVGCDARFSSPMMKSAVIAGILSTGSSAVDTGIITTPGLQYYVRHRVDGGVMVTASHNPREYNGIKFMLGDGREFTREMDRKAEDLYFSGDFRVAGWNGVGDVTVDSTALDLYISGIIEKVNVEEIRERKFTVVVDPGNGAGALTTPEILKKLGCRVLTINGHLDGGFPGRQPEPEEHALDDLKKMVIESGADFGVAHDGDADRAVFVDEKGRFVKEDVELAIFAREYVRERKGGRVVTPVSSSRVVEDVVRYEGGEVIYTEVGSPAVAEVMLKENAVFGGEGNGGLIFPEHQLCRDGGMAVAKMLEMILTKPLSEYVSEIPEYVMLKEKVPCRDKDKLLEGLREEFSEGNFTDGVRIDYEDGWLLIRPSGTEPIARVFAEAETIERARDLMQFGKNVVKKILNGG